MPKYNVHISATEIVPTTENPTSTTSGNLAVGDYQNISVSKTVEASDEIDAINQVKEIFAKAQA